MAYSIIFKASAAKSLKRLSKEIQAQIVPKIEALANNPYPAKSVKLSGNDSIWRVRSGDYRIVYTVENDILRVLIVDIGHRREIYQGY